MKTPSGRIRLHLGSGDKSWPLWVNVDAHGDPDIVAEIHKKLPFDTDYADEIQAIHVVEHIPRLSVDNMLADWMRVLKRGGKIAIEVPCLNKIAQMIVDGEPDIQMTTLGIFGDPRDKKQGMMHQWSWTREELTNVMRNVGFKDVKEVTPLFHVERRDMRIEGIKP